MLRRAAICLVGAGLACAAQSERKPLAVSNPTLHQFEDGPILPAAHEFLPGEQVFLAFRIANFQKSDKESIALRYTIDAVDSADVLLAEPVSGKVDAELAPEDKNWTPKVRYNVLAPLFAASGTYRVRIAVADELSGALAKLEAPFRVRGKPVEPSETLVARNFRFLRSEDDGPPLAAASYRAGDAVWGRFEITGYKAAEKNRIHVEYDIAVLGPGDKEMFSQPKAAVEQAQPFYPMRYVPGILSLALRPGTPPGEYTIVLTLRDEVGPQNAQSRHVFRIE